ncbi:MAG: hypothetical protein EOS54_26825 [Mesorhizobium sp.]|uniref:hypothetical protein n=1 Tax=unclassified Mesorhizobium TaxID=325217 RepID=UPI000FD3DD12|nr:MULTISPECIES: hypothetical protein [unclassified Mesorhizobium]RVD41773.1 hypothetical protein EN742_09215 [Mesorhizobium sp. M4A.F.Ca.ET.020.02.1.1]RWC20917.1 MAG: hypothetical protein EOS53_07190 [Mesorhizobium sp.]RWC25498.1 MAG: hypothetical protein EOS70_33575 [Mesorhizobium sp.]RWC40609.1 MAG: hypothetical protein EOS54_26825 [Mesorhizobium sp.]RWD40521.1 MAG: hypothetical protein EOS35_31405 [Mesorhizobium sp.]
MLTLGARAPEDRWPEFKAAPPLLMLQAIGRDLAAGLVKDYEAELPARSPASWTTSKRQSRT